MSQTKILTNNLTKKTRAFSPGQAYKSNEDFDGQPNKLTRAFTNLTHEPKTTFHKRYYTRDKVFLHKLQR